MRIKIDEAATRVMGYNEYKMNFLDGVKNVGEATVRVAPDDFPRLIFFSIGEKYRGRGYGKEGVNKLCRYFKKMGYPKIGVWSLFPAEEFYKKLGFYPVERDFGETLMLKELRCNFVKR